MPFTDQRPWPKAGRPLRPRLYRRVGNEAASLWSSSAKPYTHTANAKATRYSKR